MTQYDPIRKPSVTALVKTLRESDSDFEWCKRLAITP